MTTHTKIIDLGRVSLRARPTRARSAILDIRIGDMNTECWAPLGDRHVCHVVLLGGTVPVPLLRRGTDDIAFADDLDRSATGLNSAFAVCDVQDLSADMRVPRGSRSRVKMDRDH